MTGYSKKKSRFPEVRIKQIYYLYELLSRSNRRNLSWIEDLYKKKYNNFDQLISFLRELGIAEIDENKLYALEERHDIREVIIKKVVRGRVYKNIFDDFIDSCEALRDEMVIKPSDKVRFELSNLRDLLLDIDLIKFDYRTKRYGLSTSLALFLSNKVDSPESGISKKKFEYLKSQQEKVGERAEKEIIKYERKRLKGYPNLIKKIKYVANIDVGAGYDILSYRVDEKIGPIFIEVKAVSKIDYNFFWSRNELEKARRNPDNYKLYLLPVRDNEGFDLSALEIVKNPYANVYLGSNWNKRIEKYSFSKQ